MANILSSASALLKKIFSKNKKIKIDNGIDSVHKVASVFYVIAFLFITANHYIGEPIKCSKIGHPAYDLWSPEMIENYCYLSNAYVDPDFMKKVLEFRNSSVTNDLLKRTTNDNQRSYQSSYYWLPYLILIQALSFTIPRCFWKYYEKDDPKKNGKDKNEDNKEGDNNSTLKYFWKMNFQKQNFYFYAYYISELLYLTNVVAQYFFIDFLLGHDNLMKLVIHAFNFDSSDLDYHFHSTFPVLVICEIISGLYFKSGDSMKTICTLTFNYLFKKLIVISWCISALLIFLTSLNISCFTLIALCPMAKRNRFLYYLYNRDEDVKQFFNSNILIGDWFFLFSLKRNLDPGTELKFKEFIKENFFEKHKSLVDNSAWSTFSV